MTRKLTTAERALLDDIVGQVEIAEMTGASRGLVSMWIKRHRDTLFPPPVLDLRAGRFYLRSDVMDWYENVYPSQRRGHA